MKIHYINNFVYGRMRIHTGEHFVFINLKNNLGILVTSLGNEYCTIVFCYVILCSVMLYLFPFDPDFLKLVKMFINFIRAQVRLTLVLLCLVLRYYYLAYLVFL
jgi:hypothetical protein